MKKLLLFIYGAILPTLAFSQYLSKEFTLDDSDVTTSVALNVSVSNQDSLVLLGGTQTSSGLFVSGCANLANNYDSYVRITLRDTYNTDYLIYELYPLLAEGQQCPFSKIGLETAYLDNIQAQSIKIETLNASVTLDSVYFVVPERSSRNMSKAIPNRKSQCERIVSRLNDRIVSGNKTWRAGLTFVSQMTFEEKKGMFGGKVPVLHGFDYYKGGVFVMPEFYQSVSRNANTRTSDNYVSEWDWRNRHGKNWMTSVKNQNVPVNCNSCWAFSAIGAFESYINLYYNQLLNFDLSEQEILSCAGAGNCERGGRLSSSLAYIVSSGVIPEDCFRYTATNDTCERKCSNPSDRLSFENYSLTYTTDEDSIKRMLFKSPICFGILPWWHFVVLLGFRQIESGEFYYTANDWRIKECILENNPLIGHPAWLIKNSWGADWGDNGYGYVAMSLSKAYNIYKLTGEVFSQVLTSNDIVCEDTDDDGYFNWGLGPRPSSCPAWAPDKPDGNDTDPTKGGLNEFGYCEELSANRPSYEYISNDSVLATSECRTKYLGILRGASVTIQAQQTFINGTKLLLDNGATLIVDGITIDGTSIEAYSGCKIILNNNAKILKPFIMPSGGKLVINKGMIE